MKTAMLNCLNANDRCGGVACMKAFYDRKAAFAAYGDEDLQMLGFLRCSHCGAYPQEDADMREKLDRLVREGVETVHIGVCAVKHDSGKVCPCMDAHAAYLQERGIRVVWGTHGMIQRENYRNQAPDSSRELLAVSFGTTAAASRKAAVGGIETALEAAFPDWCVRRAFTSGVVLKRLAAVDVHIDSISQALERAAAGGVRELAVQPTLMMPGLEYEKLLQKLEPAHSRFDSIRVGAPLLSAAEDFTALSKALWEETAQFLDGRTAVCFMGHGTESRANCVYRRLEVSLRERSRAFFVGTVEAEPTLAQTVAGVQEAGYSRAILLPLMIVAGDHVRIDMMGSEDSWKTAFEAAGLETICIPRGLGELAAVQACFVRHARAICKE